jgi:putative ABC transport system substrate-binding protein
MALVSGCLFSAPFAAEAQKSGKIARMGLLLVGPASSAPSREEIAKSQATHEFWLGMKELGWVKGQNLVVERRWGESDEQLRAGAADLVRMKVDVLVVQGLGLAGIARLETKTIPIVIQNAGGDLVAAGLVASLVQILSDDLISKRLELLKALVPRLSRVAFLGEDVTNSAIPQMLARYVQQAAVAARTLGIELHPVIVHQPEDLAPPSSR